MNDDIRTGHVSWSPDYKSNPAPLKLKRHSPLYAATCSPSSLTPETDAAWACFKGYTELLRDVKDLSCKLERERDEARRELENHIALSIHTCHEKCQRPMCIMRRERDEARELAEKWRRESYSIGNKKNYKLPWE